MANRVRPRCSKCNASMTGLFRLGPQRGIVRVRDTFVCAEHDVIARGRRKVRYLKP